jgi:outer membrane protein assembly factor BamB
MHLMRRILTRHESCLSLLTLLMVCAIASCAAPVPNKNTSTNTSSNAPLTQSTPIVYASNADDGSLQAISGRDGSPLWRTPVGHISSMPTIVGDTIYTIGFCADRQKDGSRRSSERWEAALEDGSPPIPRQPVTVH